MVRTAGTIPDRTSFVGRSEEIAWLLSRVREHARLVIILGPPGMGKTRLLRALESRLVAKEAVVPRLRVVGRDSIADAYVQESSVVFVDLTVTRSLGEIASAVGYGMGLTLRGEAEPAQAIARVGEAIAATGAGVVLLDNFEQVASFGAASVGVWLDMAPQTTFVVTSRIRLRVPGEECFDMPALPREDAVRLFVERARLVRADYQPLDRERDAVAELVTRLDGIPLAIELAAARAHLFSASQLVQRLRSQLELLRRPDRSAEDRHASLRAALDGSWSLLTDHERSALAQCAVFRGPFRIEAAEGILDLSAHPDAPPVLDVIDALRSHSLLRVNEGRCSLYESVREYADEKLASSGEAEAAILRHARWFVDEGDRCHRALETAEGVRGLIEARENLVAVVERVQTIAPELAMRAGFVLLAALFKRGPRVLFDRIAPIVIDLARSRGDKRTELAALLRAFSETSNRGEIARGMPLVLRMREIVEDPALADQRLQIDATFAWVEMAKANTPEALRIARKATADAGPVASFAAGFVHHYLASVAFTAGRYREAEEIWRRVYEWATLNDGPLRLRAVTVSDLTTLLVYQGRIGDALALLPAFEEINASIDEWQTEIIMGLARAVSAHARGELRAAAEHLQRAFDLTLEEREATYSSACLFLELVQQALAKGEVKRVRDATSRYLAMCEGRTATFNVAAGHLALAMAHDLSEEFDLAHRAYERSIALAQHLPPIRTFGELHRALSFARQGDIDAARSLLDAASRACDEGLTGMVAGTIELHRANLASDPAVAKRIRDRARTLFEGVDSAEGRFILAAADAHFDGSKLEGTPPSFLATRSSQAFESSKTHRSTTARLRVANDGRWFELAGNRVDLTRRRALRLLVLALAERHRSNGPGLTQVELLEAGWPGERVDVESGAKRVYTSINLLRTLGLREILTTRDDGYLIRPEIQVSVESHEAS